MINAVTASLLVAFLWGLSPILQKYVLNTVSPTSLIFYEGIIVFICLFIFGYFKRDDINNDLKKIDLKILILILITSIFTTFLPNIIYLNALQGHETYVISALIFSAPFFTFLVAYFIMKEKVSFYGFLGVILIVLGVICLAFNEKGQKELFASWDLFI